MLTKISISLGMALLGTLLLLTRLILASSTDVLLFLLTLLSAGAAAVGLLLLLRRGKGAKGASEALETLRREGIEPLGSAIWELARGNLCVHPSVDLSELETLAGAEYPELKAGLRSSRESIERATEGVRSLTGEPVRRICFTGIDDYQHGQLIARLLGEHLDGRGTVALVAVNRETNYSVFRERGFRNVVENRFPGISVVDVLYTNRDHSRAREGVAELLEKYPDLSAIYQLEEASTLESLAVLRARSKPGAPAFFAHGKRSELAPYFDSGHLTTTITQSPYLQGYNPLVYLYNSLVSSWQPERPRMLITPRVVTPENYREHLGQEVESEGLAELVEPEQERRVKLAYLIPKNRDFWPPVYSGAKAAQAVLQERGCEVRVILPPKDRNPYDLTSWTENIDRLVAEGFDGFAVPLFTDRLIPVINGAVRKGLRVTTYNQEPSTLRGLLLGVGEQTNRVATIGETLNSGAGESERATSRIGETLVTVGEVMNAQREQAAEADQAMKNLTSLVGTVAAETRAAGDRAKQMATAAQSGRKAIESTREASDRLTESARATQSLINDLADRSREIRSITGSIEDIAAQTHLLAMNASIEAARAGEAGAGFSVVAHEIRNLSEESGRATERITTLLEEIINSMSEAAERSNQEITIIQSSNEEVSEAEAELESIDRSASTNTEKMEDVLGSLSAMEANAQKVAETISDLHRSNEEHLEQFELVREESSRLNRQVAAVARTAKELLAMAQSQRSLIASLELEEE